MEHSLGFPSDFLPRSRKIEKAYGLQYARAIYDNYIKENQRFTSQRGRFINNRKYAEGLQDPEMYKELMGLTGDSSYLNLNWSIVSIIPMFIDMLTGEFINVEYKINAEAIDQMSLTSKDYERARLLTKIKLKDLDDYIKETTGIDVNEGESFLPTSVDEIDLHMQLNHKLATEIVIEEVIKYIYQQNNFRSTKWKLYRDLIVLKKAAIKCFINSNDDIEIRYVDPVNLVTSYSVKDDFSDLKFAAEMIMLPIHQIRRLDKSLSEEDLFNIAKECVGKHGNMNEWSFGTYNSYYSDPSVYGFYDNFLVPCLDFQFISIDVKTFEEKQNNYGGIYFNEKSYGYTSDDKKRKVIQKEIEYKYGGVWVIGSDIILNYGIKEDLLRKKKNNVYSSETELDYIIYSPNIYEMENKSLVERMIPHADEIQLVALKMQHLVAKLRPPGKTIDVAALNNILLGKGVASTPLEIYEFFNQTGDMFINSKDDEGGFMNRPPVTDNKDGFGPILSELINKYNFHRQQIRDITGLNEMRDGVSPDSDTPVYVQQNALKASKNSTREILESFQSIFLRSAEFSAIYLSDLIADNRIDSYKNILGKVSVDLLKLNKEIELAEIGISLEALPEEEDRVMLEQSIQVSLQQKELRWEDAMTARDLAKQSTKKATQFIALKRKQYMNDEMKKQQAAVEANSQAQQQSNQQTAQNAQMTNEQLHQFELAKIQIEKDLEARNKELEYKLKIQLAQEEGRIKMGQIEKQADESFKATALKSTQSTQPGMTS